MLPFRSRVGLLFLRNGSNDTERGIGAKNMVNVAGDESYKTYEIGPRLVLIDGGEEGNAPLLGAIARTGARVGDRSWRCVTTNSCLLDAR